MFEHTTRFTIARWLASMMVAVEAGIHGVLAPSHLQQQFYVGLLFIVADALLAAVLVSLLIVRMRLVGWVLGAGVCAGMFLGFVLSRTTGLPGYHESWTSDGGLGLASLPGEVVFIACAAIGVRLRRAPAGAAYPIEVHDAELLAKREARDRAVHSQRSL